MRRLTMFCIALICPTLALAHAASTSYLQLGLDRDGLVSGRWDIALRDLDQALHLDADGDGQLSWGEVREASGAIGDYALSHLGLVTASERCVLRPGDLKLAEHADGLYAALSFDGRCRVSDAAEIEVDYSLLFDLDRQHRGLLKLQDADETLVYTGIFSPSAPRLRFGKAGESGSVAVFANYFREGLWHVWTGVDHLLFLTALFLPAVLRRERGNWIVASKLGPALWQTAGIVTSFTLAHAITLTLAALGWLHWPSRWVEAAVAATVAFAALNNLWPMVNRRLALIAGLFGLIHGSAIAGALLELGLPQQNRVWALAAFNLGVEAAQLLLIAIVLPVTYALRRSRLYRHAVLIPGSMLIALIGLIWLIERTFELKWLPF
jgi:hypothetical protein